MTLRKAPPEPGQDLALGPTSGLLSGWIGEGIVLAVVATSLIDHRDLDGARLILGALLGGALVWAFLLRSRVVLRPSEVLLRNAYVDTAVPYTLIDRFVVRSVTHVFVHLGDDADGAGGKEKKYVGSGVGRAARSMMRRPREVPGKSSGTPGGMLGAAGTAPTPAPKKGSADVADFLEEQVADRRRRARDWPGAPEAAGGEVRRTVAWPEVVVSVVFAVAFAISMLV
jgi:hypothetical protein